MATAQATTVQAAPSPAAAPAVASEPLRFERFAYFRNLDRSFEALARQVRTEAWGPQADPLRVLKSYIIQTYLQAVRKRRLTPSDDGGATCFDTGLCTRTGRRLFAYFERNKVPGKQEWYFADWLEEHELREVIPRPPVRPWFFEEQSRELLYDPTIRFRVDSELVLNTGDNLVRVQSVFPVKEGVQSTVDIRARFAEAVKRARVIATTSYRAAVPQYFPPRESIQFLLPLYLRGTLEDDADLALVVEKRPAERNPDPEDPNDWEYASSSVLHLENAYTNARILGPVESTWLTPRAAFGLAREDSTRATPAAPTAPAGPAADKPAAELLQQVLAQQEQQRATTAEIARSVNRVLQLLDEDEEEDDQAAQQQQQQQQQQQRRPQHQQQQVRPRVVTISRQFK